MIRRPGPDRARSGPIAVALAGAALLAVALAACSGAIPSAGETVSPAAAADPTPAGSSTPAATAPASPWPSPAVTRPASASPIPASPVVGVVIDVDSAGLGKVRGFTVRTDDGETVTFEIGRLLPGSFDAGHLTEHIATGVPVRVTFEVDGGSLIATKLEDA